MEILIQYAMKFVGLPYFWTGNNPVSGFDCSGLVLEILRSAGLWDKSDARAQDIYNYFDKNGSYKSSISEGCLLFFGKSVNQITHVAFAIDKFRYIEAGGGDSKTVSLADAIKQNAFVRIRHKNKGRTDMVAILKPDYATIGLI